MYDSKENIARFRGKIMEYITQSSALWLLYDGRSGTGQEW